MTGENIVCFTKDWAEDPTSSNHVMRALARDNRVLWLNSVCTRRPDFASGRDLRKIGRKLASFLKGPKQVADNLWIYTPLVLPFPHNPVATALNRRLLALTLAALRRRLGMKDFQLWSFLPTTAEYMGLGESLAVYYCTDEWSAFAHVDGERVAASEQVLCRKADVVFTTSRSLLERKRAFNPRTHLVSHGVDHAHFAKALDETMRPPPEIATLPRPVIGFFGWIERWIDLDLLAWVAERRPEWSMVLVGKATVDVSGFGRYPNVHVLGRRPYADLPQYCKAFDVAVCPFVLNELTHNVNPIKLREYLSAGVPTVSTAIPEAASYSSACRVAADREGFLAACEAALAEGSGEQRRRRSDTMRTETWQGKAEEIGRIVQNVKARKRRESEPAPRARPVRASVGS